jgi:hypothetical protein
VHDIQTAMILGGANSVHPEVLQSMASAGPLAIELPGMCEPTPPSSTQRRNVTLSAEQHALIATNRARARALELRARAIARRNAVVPLALEHEVRCLACAQVENLNARGLCEDCDTAP